MLNKYKLNNELKEKVYAEIAGDIASGITVGNALFQIMVSILLAVLFAPYVHYIIIFPLQILISILSFVSDSEFKEIYLAMTNEYLILFYDIMIFTLFFYMSKIVEIYDRAPDSTSEYRVTKRVDYREIFHSKLSSLSIIICSATAINQITGCISNANFYDTWLFMLDNLGHSFFLDIFDIFDIKLYSFDVSEDFTFRALIQIERIAIDGALLILIYGPIKFRTLSNEISQTTDISVSLDYIYKFVNNHNRVDLLIMKHYFLSDLFSLYQVLLNNDITINQLENYKLLTINGDEIISIKNNALKPNMRFKNLLKMQINSEEDI
jgi:hypothetical protein